MVDTVKFSQFIQPGPLLATDWVAGLDGAPGVGTNAVWPFTGSSGSGGVTQTFPQSIPPVVAGKWVKITPGTGIYADGQADNAQDGEIVGIVTTATATNFTIQQSGYITSAMAVPGISGLTAGTVYFLDTATLGSMVAQDAVMNNQVSRPVFYADSATSGWVLPYRPLLVGGAAPVVPPVNPTSPSIVPVNQINHMFIPGDVLYIVTANVAASAITYAKASNASLAMSQVAGVVSALPAPTANQFTLQFDGYNTGSITTDDIGNPIIPSTIYYLSSVPGKVTSVVPANNAINKPVYYSEQGAINFGVSAGYILPQRPLNLSALNNNTELVIHANAFNPGQAVYISGDNIYSLASAATLAQSQVAGIVTAATGASFYVQQSGWMNGIINGTYVDTGAPVSGQILYLSATPGNLTSVVPSAVNAISKPVYIQQITAGLVGQILPQRPIVITGGGGLLPLIATQAAANSPFVSFDNILNGTYDNIQIFIYNMAPIAVGVTLYMQVGIGVATYQNTNYFGNISNQSSGSMAVAVYPVAVNTAFSLCPPGLMNNTGTEANMFNLYLSNLNSANYKSLRGEGVYNNIGFISGCDPAQQWQGAGAITSIRFFMSAGNISTGTFRIYGL